MGKIKVIFNQALMISTAILVGLGVEAFINFLAGGEATFTWHWYMLLSIVLAGILCALPSLAIMSLETVTGKRMWIRIVIHFICVGLVLSLLGFLFGWYKSWPEYGTIMILYVIIYALVWLYTWWMYMKEDKEINEKIKDFQDEE